MASVRERLGTEVQVSRQMKQKGHHHKQRKGRGGALEAALHGLILELSAGRPHRTGRQGAS